MSTFCNVISNTNNKNNDLSRMDETNIDFEYLRSIIEYIEKETQSMVELFERQEKAIAICENMLYLNEFSIKKLQTSIYNLIYCDNELKGLENQLNDEDGQFTRLSKVCTKLENLMELNSIQAPIEYKRHFNSVVQQVEQLMCGTQSQIDYMQGLINEINSSQPEITKKKYEVQDVVTEFLHYYCASMETLEASINNVSSKIASNNDVLSIASNI